MSAHTPTPWHQDGGQGTVLRGKFANEHVAFASTPEDAAHIVRCVNTHDELVRQRDDLAEALVEVRRQCSSAATLGATGPGFYEDLADTIDAALGKIRR